jgi:PhnB protein
MVMIEAEWSGIPTRAPSADGSSPVVLYVYVENVDETMERAIAAGARLLMPLTNQFWGDRTAWFIDPSGHVWTAATRVEETTEQDRQDRYEVLKSQDSRDSATPRLPPVVPCHVNSYVNSKGEPHARQ